MVVNAPFMKGWAGPGELSVFEEVVYDELDITQLLLKELGQEDSAYFKTIEPQPFAAGSFGQVYRATLHDDRQVAIKVLKPSIVANLDGDLKMLARLMKLVKFSKFSSYLDFAMLFDEFIEITKRETDYIQEARTTKWFYNYFSTNPDIVVPRIYDQLCTRHIITQDYIGGISLAKLLKEHTAGKDASALTKERIGSDFWWQLELVGKEIVHASLWSEFMLGDPHPGNIKFLEGNKVGLIDFGIVATTPADKHAFFNMLKIYKTCYDGSFNAGDMMITMLRFFDNNLAQAIAAIERHGASGSIFNKISSTTTAEFIKHIDHTGKNPELVSTGGLLRVFILLVNNGNRYGLRINTESAATLRASRMYVQVIRQFARSGEDLALIHSILYKEIDYTLNHMQLLPEPVPARPMSFENALEVLGAWLGQVAEADPSLYAQLRASIKVRNYV